MLYPNATEGNVRQLMSMARDQKAAYRVVMTPERIREMKATFKECDTDGSGDVSRSEFIEGIQNAGKLQNHTLHNRIELNVNVTVNNMPQGVENASGTADVEPPALHGLHIAVSACNVKYTTVICCNIPCVRRMTRMLFTANRCTSLG